MAAGIMGIFGPKNSVPGFANNVYIFMANPGTSENGEAFPPIFKI